MEISSAPAYTILTALERMLERAITHARQVTQAGQDIDDVQVHCERLAYRATQLHAAQELLRYAEALGQEGQDDTMMRLMALAFTAEMGQKWLAEVDAHLSD